MKNEKKKHEYLEVFDSLNFLSKSLQLQYTNFLMVYQNEWIDHISLEEVIERLKKEEPIEYVINRAEFRGNLFYVDQRCLIPRYETEEIVKKTLDFINENQNVSFTVIDVGTGSGSITLSIAKELRIQNIELRIIGIDISKDALEVAKINRERLNLEDSVEFIEADFHDFDFSKYENLILLANLPYIPNSRKLQLSVENFEPKLALFGGEKGDELIQDLKSKIGKLKNIKMAIFEGDDGMITVHSY